MRVTSEFWVSALSRRVFAEGGFAAGLRKGAAEAGAIFVGARGRDSTLALFGPAPQSDYAAGKPDERGFSRLSAATQDEVDSKLEREARFDPDFWVVEIEPGRSPAETLLGVTPA